MPEGIQNFDALEWFERYFAGRVHFDYEELRPVLCFSMMWNLFETVACQKNANPNSIRKSVEAVYESGRLDGNKYQRYLDYFRNRYLRDSNIDEIFDRLLLTHPASRVIVEKALNGEVRDSNNIVYALLLVAHRIRNNLFHGNKEITTLYMQIELFRAVNSLLADFIEDVRAA